MAYEVNLLNNMGCDGWRMFPNPTTNDLILNLPDETLKKVRIYNNRGQIVKKYDFPDKSPNNLYEINFNLSPGIYYLNIEMDVCSSTKKFVVAA